MAYTKKAEATRSRILDIAAGLILQKGYSEMRLDQVLSEASVQKGNFYYYFESKADMSHAAMKEVILPKACAWIDGLISRVSPGKSAEGFVNALCESLDENKGFVASAVALFTDLGNLHEAFGETYNGFLAELAGKFEGLLAATGSNQSPRLLANLFVGCLVDFKANADIDQLRNTLGFAINGTAQD